MDLVLILLKFRSICEYVAGQNPGNTNVYCQVPRVIMALGFKMIGIFPFIFL